MSGSTTVLYLSLEINIGKYSDYVMSNPGSDHNNDSAATETKI